MTAPSDEALLQAAFAGQQSAYRELYERYARLVRAVCYDATGNLADAQDLSQEVFLLAYEKLDGLRNPDCFGKWVVGIARLRCRQWLRETSRRRCKVTRPGDVEPVTTDSSNDDRIERLRKMMRKLSEKERLALHTFYLQGKSAEKARRIMGMSMSGFYRILTRARKRLEHLLVQEE